MSDLQPDLTAHYILLNLPKTATLAELDKAYFQLKAEKLSQQARQELPALKTAYRTIKSQLQARLKNDDKEIPSLSAIDRLQTDLRQQRFEAKITIIDRQLHIRLCDRQWPERSKAIAYLHRWLKQTSEIYPDLQEIQTVQISAHRNATRPVWQHTIPMPGAASTFADHDLTSFQSRLVQLLGFPGLLLIAMLFNTVPGIKFLLRGVTIWFHEFGHATVAWLSGRKAIPLPFGWTNVEPTRSPLVYIGILILLGLMGWAGYREKRRWPMILAVAIAILQFYMTWLMPTDTFEMLLAFGGIGGEFYLCTLLIISFFFPLPEYFRWDIYRYPTVLGAAFTFWGSFSLWRQIDRGQQSIPWGSLWGGADHLGGDMNQLSHSFGWSDQHIINVYNTLSGLCLSLIIGVYLYRVMKYQRPHLILFWHQCLASYGQASRRSRR